MEKNEHKVPQLLQLITERHCKRHFLRDTPVPLTMIEQALLAARNAPSSQNNQPWKVEVLTGKARDELSAKLCEDFDTDNLECPEYKNRPSEPDEQLASRIFEYGKEFYALYGIERNDVAGRKTQRRLNYTFYNAPVELVLHIPSNAVAGTFVDAGCFLQALCLAFASFGLGCCPQFSVAARTKVVKQVCGLGDDRLIVCGIAVGWPDEAHFVNSFVPTRCKLNEFVTFHS